jgi:hypothetical protein
MPLLLRGAVLKLFGGVAGIVLALSLQGQGKDHVVGVVTSADPDARRLTLKTDEGPTLAVAIQEGASLLRAKPGATSLKEASPVSLADIAVGDRVLVWGVLSENNLAARRIVVMTRDDIAEKQDAERAEWRRRGILGVVTAVEEAKGEITLEVHRGGATETLVLPTSSDRVVFRRYAPDSVRFSDARPSGLGEVLVGDQLRALGVRSGASFVAEQIVFGSFRAVSGDVVSVEDHALTMTEDPSGRRLSVVVGQDARLRRLSPEFAARLARPREHPGGGMPERPPTREGGEDLLERLPAVALGDLKPGARILVLSTKGNDAARLNAIAVLAGLEALRPPGSTSRMGRAPDVGLPADLLDLGLSVP